MLSRFRRYLQQHGARQTAIAIARRARDFFYAEQRLIVTVKDLGSIVEPWEDGDVRLEALSPEHLPGLAELNRKRNRPEVDRRFARYVEQGFHGFVGYLGDELIGYYWWVDRDAPNTYPDLRKLGLALELREGEVYGSDFFMLEQHRGQGNSADFLFKLESGLRDLGYERLWGYVLSDNRPARWIYSTRGYAPQWIVHRRKVMFFKRANRESP